MTARESADPVAMTIKSGRRSAFAGSRADLIVCHEKTPAKRKFSSSPTWTPIMCALCDGNAAKAPEHNMRAPLPRPAYIECMTLASKPC
eukprot:6205899-Pleurochrysis_carterae.AAC.2